MTSPQETQAARRYADLRYRLWLAQTLVGLGAFALLQGSGLSHELAQCWRSLATADWLTAAGYLASVGAVYYAALLPLHVYGSFVLERRFGLSRLTLPRWLIRESKQVVVGGVVALLLFEGLYGLLRALPQTWPIWATIGWVAVSVLMARVFPTWLVPLFYRMERLGDDGIVARLLAVCERAGLPVLGVFRVHLGVETRKANAALAGWGGSRRVLVSDTLLSEFTPEEIEGMLAHEVAHHRYHHVTWLLIVSGLGAWLAFQLTASVSTHWVRALGLTGIEDLAGFPALMLWFSALGLLALPLQNGFSRALEWQADRAALRWSSVPAAFAGALRRLAALNLADPNPPRWIEWWLYDHPAISRRIQAAESGGG